MLPIIRQISKYNHYDYNNPQYVIIHYVGANSSAKNNADYFCGGDRQASAHYFVDDTSIYQVVEDNKGAWHIGNTVTAPNNWNSIGIEMCLVDGQVTSKTEENTVELTKVLMDKYNIGIENVRTHAEVTNYGKTCPNWSANNWDRWRKFKSKLNYATKPETDVFYRVKLANGEQIGSFRNLDSAKSLAQVNKCNVYRSTDNVLIASYLPAVNPAPKPIKYRVKNVNGVQLGAFNSYDNAEVLAKKQFAIIYDANNKIVKSFVKTDTDEMYRYSENGTFYPNCTINFRNEPYVHSSNPVQGNYGNGESVKYDIVVIGERYNWISWVSASSGVRRYMPIRDKVTGEPMWGKAI